MTTSKVGYLGKVSIGSSKILGMGNWSMPGKSVEELDDTEFGDTSKKYVMGVEDGGVISFSGNHKPSDASGQLTLKEAFDQRTELTDLRLYIDLTSYYSPNKTTGYLHPGYTSNANTVISTAVIQSEPVNYDKGALGQCEFTARINGNMTLV